MASRTKRRVYSLQLSWYSDRCGCLGINTARSRHESRTTFHIQCSERRCRTNYNSRKYDTDIVVICVYYASTLLRDLPELWVRTARDSYLPIHGIAAALGPASCRALPFIHSLSGRDTTSYPYFTGKKTCIKSSMQIDIPALEDFADGDQGPARITSQVV